MRLDFIAYARLLARTVSLHEDGAEGHSQRMETLVERMVAVLRQTEPLPEDAALWPQAVLVHDFGKLFVPSQILRKPQGLTPYERGLMQQHTVMGREEFSRLAADFRGGAPMAHAFWEVAAKIAGGHHERPDGMGYPLGLKGEAVPLVLRVARTADVYDALTARRAYREALTSEEAFRVMREEIGGFDDDLLEALAAATEQGLLHAGD